ncbi:MAG: NAD-dependent epimerase/dehydratase family protein [Myxococcota bacterium]
MPESTTTSPPMLPKRQGKTLVTGATGHLGANLVRRLIADNVDVRVLLRPTSAGDPKSAAATAANGLPEGVEIAQGDLNDVSALRAALSDCTTAYHCAALVSTVSGDASHQREIFATNVVGTHNFLKAARQENVGRVVVSGSFSAIGHSIDAPEMPGNEDTPWFPFERTMPYERSKAHALLECYKAAAQGQDVVVATSCAIIGPHDYKPSRMGQALLDFSHHKLRAYIPGGFEFVAARDIVEGHILAMRDGRSGHNYVFSSEFLTLDALLNIFEDVTGRSKTRMKLPAPMMERIARVTSPVLTRFFPNVPQRLTPGAIRILQMQRRADVTKAKTELGFEPTPIRTAVEEAYACFVSRGLIVPPPAYAPPQTKSATSSARDTSAIQRAS